MDAKQIRQILVLGAGTMGQQIALLCAWHGYQVSLYDLGPQLLEQENPLEKPHDLQHQCLLHVSTRNQDWHELLDSIGIDSASTENALTFSSTALAISAAIEGLGVALTDRGLVERELRYGLLVIPFDLQLESDRAFYLSYQKSRRMTHGMKAFHDWMIEQMKLERRAPLEEAV